MNFRSIGLMSLSFLIALSFSACGSSSGGGEESTDGGTNSLELIKSTQLFGQRGNLWKPRAEPKSSTAGLLVVLLGAEHTDRFDTCGIETIDGEFTLLDCNDRVPWSHEPFSCVANGNREHWRALFTCDQAAQVRVVCRNATEEVTFEAPGPAISAVCSRHG